MSTSRKLLSIALVLAGVVGLLRWGSGQVDGGGGLGNVLAHDLEDLDALAQCIADKTLRAQLAPTLVGNNPISGLSFRRFSQGPTGDRVYLGQIATGSSHCSFVHYRPVAGQPGTTYARPAPPCTVSTHSVVIPDATGLNFLAYALTSASQATHQTCADLIALAPLTGLRVQRCIVAGTGVHYRLELYFDGDTSAPKVTLAADVTNHGFGSLIEE